MSIGIPVRLDARTFLCLLLVTARLPKVIHLGIHRAQVCLNVFLCQFGFLVSLVRKGEQGLAFGPSGFLEPFYPLREFLQFLDVGCSVLGCDSAVFKVVYPSLQDAYLRRDGAQGCALFCQGSVIGPRFRVLEESFQVGLLLLHFRQLIIVLLDLFHGIVLSSEHAGPYLIPFVLERSNRLVVAFNLLHNGRDFHQGVVGLLEGLFQPVYLHADVLDGFPVIGDVDILPDRYVLLCCRLLVSEKHFRVTVIVYRKQSEPVAVRLPDEGIGVFQGVIDILPRKVQAIVVPFNQAHKEVGGMDIYTGILLNFFLVICL